MVILNATIVSFLEGMISSNLCLRFVSTKDGPIIPLQRFEIADRQKQLLKSILMAPGPSQVLVSGAPGTGKTEFVRSILESAGRRAFFLSFSPREIDESSEDRRTRLRIATRTVACAGGVLVVDEAEDLLNSEDPMARKAERGWLVDFMESAAASVVWIITSTEFVYPSVLQRFTHSLELKSLGTTERRAVWQEFAAAQETAGLLREDEISDLAQTYEIDANGIATALRTIRGVKPGSALEAKAMLRDLLGSHARLLGMKSTAPTGRQSSRYDMLALHTDTDPKVILDYARRFCRQKDAHTDGEHLDNCAMLFWGPPAPARPLLSITWRRAFPGPSTISAQAISLGYTSASRKKTSHAPFMRPRPKARSSFWTRRTASSGTARMPSTAGRSRYRMSF